MKEELIIYGGTILPMWETGIPEAILIRDGIIADMGKLERLQTLAPKAKLRNLEHKVLMPSFIDAHSHLTQVAGSLLQVSLSGADTDDAVVERIQNYIVERNVAPGTWITANSYDPTKKENKKRISKEILDQAFEEYPIVIQYQSGHMGILNTKAMQLLNINGNTEQIEGGLIEQIEGVATGYLEENAYFHYQKMVPMPGMNEWITAYKMAQKYYTSYGITTIQEGMLVKEMLPIYQLLIAANLLETDVVAYPDPDTYMLMKETWADYFGKYEKHIKIGGIKIVLDGSPQSKTAWMRTPYIGTEECGYGTMTDEQVCKAFELAAKEKIQLLAHCNGDAATEQFIRCLEVTEKAYPILKELRPVMIHAQFLGLDQLERAAELGAMASFFIAHVYHWGEIHRMNTGDARASKISPAASALLKQLMFTFHQDTPVIKPDMWETIWCACNRQTKAGNTLGEDEKLSVKEAIKAVTINSAWQYGEEQKKGSIRPGKAADLIIVDKDPFQCDTNELKNIRVLETYKNGKLLYKA